MAAIVVTHVTRTLRGGRKALDDVSFEVPAGSSCALIGPAGSGKSTLLRLIARREKPDAGVIEIGEDVSQSWRIGRPELAELVDPDALEPGRNLYDNIVRGLGARGLKRRDAQEAALRAADAFGLGPSLARRAGRVSSGERARTALARAFAARPAALLFDEPFRGLDAAERAALRFKLAALRRETGAAAVFSLQDQAEALALADSLVLLDGGRVVAAGGADELYARPPTSAAARLLGPSPMNLLPVRAERTGLSLEDGTHLGGASLRTGFVFAVLGVRPEDLFAPGEGSLPAAATFPVTVELAARAGRETLVHGRVGAFPFLARLTGPVDVPAVGPLTLGARRESLHLFDAATGARL
ncbi:ATP-binding cassette domain-containing protein [Chenggangzhangella methanolivorans]